MLNQQMISPEISPLHPGQTVEEALQQMEGYALFHLPVVAEGRLAGLISENDLLDASSNQLIGDLMAHLPAECVQADDYYFSAARLMAGQNLSAVPVVVSDNEFAGTITRDRVFMQMVVQTGIASGGAVVVLQMEPSQYSIGELSKLVETNDAQITQLNTATDESTGLLFVTLRLNKQEVSDIISTFQRYEFQVVYFSGEEHYENELRRNYHHLMNFLTI
jgi:acetoin utilization protein AcuB